MRDLVDAIETLRDTEWVDLTHPLEEGIPVWPTHARFSHTVYESYELGDTSCHHRFTMGEHSGTHMDAPLHFIQEGEAHYGASEIPLDRLVGRAATIEALDLDPRKSVSADRIREWENEHSEIERGDRVLFRFGWDEYWDTDADGRRFLDDWPGLSRKAAEYLTQKGVTLVGCDTLAIDATGADEFPAHYELLGNETYVVENLANLDQLPPFTILMTFPLPIKHGSGSPIRAVALVE